MQITIDIPDYAKNILEMDAIAHKRSLEEEIAAAILNLTNERRRRGEEAWNNIKKLREKMLADRGGKLFPDCVEIIRESRENDH